MKKMMELDGIHKYIEEKRKLKKLQEEKEQQEQEKKKKDKEATTTTTTNNKDDDDVGTSSNNNATTSPPPVVKKKNPSLLCADKLMEILKEDDSCNNNMKSEDITLIQKAIQGFRPGKMKGPLENWLFDSFLCSSEEIIPNLWLGGYFTAHSKTKLLDEMKITRVVCVGGQYLAYTSPPYVPPFVDDDDGFGGVTYHVIDVDDTEKPHDVEILGSSFEDAVKFIDDGMKLSTTTTTSTTEEKQQQQQQHRTFVHCMAGASRSASVVCAYLIWKYPGMTVTEALKLVRSARPIATPNKEFVKQLEKWYDTCNTTTTP